MRASKSLWRQTPPAMFSNVLGLMGLAVAWRGIARIYPVPTQIGDVLLGIATAYLIFFGVSYTMKITVRPKALIEDMQTPPARAGITAFALAILVFTAGMLGLGIALPYVWLAGVMMLVALMILIGYKIYQDGAEHRTYSPFQYLTFVGLILCPLAGVGLGYEKLSFYVTVLSLIPFAIISYGVVRKLIIVRPPAPLRPALMIPLSPLSLFGTGFGMMGVHWAYVGFYWAAFIFALVLLSLALWLTEGGWNPVWGAFTFPIAAFVNTQIYAVEHGMGLIAKVGAIAGLLIGTPLILYIIYKASRAWIRGELAKKTGASTA